MQYSVAGVTINDLPKILTPLPQEDSHCIIVADDFKSRTVIPLSLHGVTSILNLFKRTEGEWNRGDLPRLFLTNKDLNWELNSSILKEQEHACNEVTGSLLPRPNSAGEKYLIINQVRLSTTFYAAYLTANDNFAAVLQLNVNVTLAQFSSNPNFTAALSDISHRYGTIQSNKRNNVDGNTLSKRW